MYLLDPRNPKERAFMALDGYIRTLLFIFLASLIWAVEYSSILMFFATFILVSIFVYLIAYYIVGRGIE